MTRRRDSGSTVVEYVVIVPVVMLVVLIAVQAAVYLHAANIARHAASSGAVAASHRGASGSDGEVEAVRVARESGSTEPRVAVVGSTEVEVTVTLSVPRVAPFFPSSVSRTARLPKERYVTEDRR